MNQADLLVFAPPPRPFSPPQKKRREALWLKHGRKCHWCGCETLLDATPSKWNMATVDHVIPRYKGGTNEETNTVSACQRCNNRRSHEDAKGLPDGALLGRYNFTPGPDPGPPNPKPVPKPKFVALTADDKKALMARLDAAKKPTVKLSAEDQMRAQRDQALGAILGLRKQIASLEVSVSDLTRQIEAMTLWSLIRRRLAKWIAPNS